MPSLFILVVTAIIATNVIVDLIVFMVIIVSIAIIFMISVGAIVQKEGKITENLLKIE